MAIKSELKKMIVFSNMENRKFIENYIADEAAMERKSQSALIEDHILNEILPKHRSVEYWVRDLYLGYSTLLETLSSSFSYLSAGTNWRPLHVTDKNLDLIRYAMKLCIESGPLVNKKKSEYFHFMSSLDSFIKRLEWAYEKEEYGISKRDLEFAKEVSKIADTTPLYNLYNLVLSFWDCLKDWSGTFVYLSDLAILHDRVRDNPQNRLKLVKILNDVSQDWIDPE